MTIIVIAQQKGGAGKTMLAGNLAVELEEMGLPVVALDLDPQQSLADWAGRGAGRLAQLVRGMPKAERDAADAAADAAGTEPNYLPIAQRMIDQAREDPRAVVIIDTPPSFHDLAALPIPDADLVILPVMAAQRDLDAGDATAAAIVNGMADMGQQPPRMLWQPARQRPNTRLSAVFLDELANRGLVLPLAADRVENVEAELGGLTTREYRPNSRAANEWRIIARQVAHHLNQGPKA